MQTVAYFDCYSGASGDMLLASLIDKAFDFNWFLNEIEKLKLPENSFKIEKTYVQRSNLNSCKINVNLSKHEHHHRGYTDICNIINNSSINDKAKDLSKKIFLTLAKAEASVHNKDIEEIHFHEVGAIDSIIDIVGFSICYTHLNIDKCFTSPVPVGSGFAPCSHGLIPIPAPATLEILKNYEIKIAQNNIIQEECFTPTAAAILCTVTDKCSFMPDMNKIINIGYGAGDKIFEGDIISNLRFVLGQTAL